MIAIDECVGRGLWLLAGPTEGDASPRAHGGRLSLPHSINYELQVTKNDTQKSSRGQFQPEQACTRDPFNARNPLRPAAVRRRFPTAAAAVDRISHAHERASVSSVATAIESGSRLRRRSASGQVSRAIPISLMAAGPTRYDRQAKRGDVDRDHVVRRRERRTFQGTAMLRDRHNAAMCFLRSFLIGPLRTLMTCCCNWVNAA